MRWPHLALLMYMYCKSTTGFFASTAGFQSDIIASPECVHLDSGRLCLSHYNDVHMTPGGAPQAGAN